MNFIWILLLGEIILFFAAYLFSSQDLMAPSVMMCVMFIISTLFAVLNIRKWDLQYSWKAGMIILTGMAVFVLAELFFRCLLYTLRHAPKNRYAFKQVTVSSDNNYRAIPIRMWVLIGIILYNVIICFWYFYEIKRIVGETDNIFQAFIAYRRLGIARISGENREVVGGIINQFLKFVSVSGYAAGYLFFNSILAGEKNRKKCSLLVLIMVLSLLPSVMTAGRSQTLRLLSALLIDYYILWHQKNGWNRNLSWKYIQLGVSFLLFGVPIFYYMLNILGRATNTIGMLDYASEYLGGGIALFDAYVKNPIKSTFWGEESLFGVRKIMNILGMGEESTSYNLEFRWVGQLYSNIYTFFRRPLHDFGLGGMYLFVILIAFFFAWLYYGKIKGKKQSRAVDYWVLIYSYFYYWIISSSIIQYSVAYLAAGTVLMLVALLLEYRFIARRLYSS